MKKIENFSIFRHLAKMTQKIEKKLQKASTLGFNSNSGFQKMGISKNSLYGKNEFFLKSPEIPKCHSNLGRFLMFL